MDQITRRSITLPAFLFLLVAGAAMAKQLYKYQDEAGEWHFTDVAPVTSQPVEVQRMRVEREAPKVSLSYHEVVGGFGEVRVVNGYYGPVEIEFIPEKAENARSEPVLPTKVVIPANSSSVPLKLYRNDNGKPWGYRYQYRYVFGNPQAQPASSPYRLPFAPGNAYRVTQGFFGEFSHTMPEDQYAVDIEMPEGSGVYAARDGMVADVARDFFSGGADREKYVSQANYVRILHDDGTFALYAHLKWESVTVRPGQRVRAGQVIGRTGNTGFSTGPHLHFVVQRNNGMRIESVPFDFERIKGVQLIPGAMLRH